MQGQELDDDDDDDGGGDGDDDDEDDDHLDVSNEVDVYAGVHLEIPVKASCRNPKRWLDKYFLHLDRTIRSLPQVIATVVRGDLVKKLRFFPLFKKFLHFNYQVNRGRGQIMK